jgi:hypothetical protein
MSAPIPRTFSLSLSLRSVLEAYEEEVEIATDFSQALADSAERQMQMRGHTGNELSDEALMAELEELLVSENASSSSSSSSPTTQIPLECHSGVGISPDSVSAKEEESVMPPAPPTLQQGATSAQKEGLKQPPLKLGVDSSVLSIPPKLAAAAAAVAGPTTATQN